MSEFDYDRLIQVRASVIEDGEQKIRELESEMNRLTKGCYEAVTKQEQLEVENAHLRVCLKRLEWTDEEGPLHCIVCGTLKRYGHDSGCWLAAEIAREGLDTHD